MKLTALAKERSGIEMNDIIEPANEVMIGSLITMVGLAGVWGCACLIVAIGQSGGILNMIGNYLTAIGM